MGGRARHTRLHPRLQTSRRRRLSRQHVDRRADVDAEEPVDQHVDGQPHVRRLARRPFLPLLEGRKVPGLRSRRRRRASAGRHGGAAFSNPVKAAKADTYLFSRQTFVEYPDLRVSGPGFKDAKKISDANPQQKDYVWGHRMLFDYKLKDGQRAQGILTLPDDYKPGEK